MSETRLGFVMITLWCLISAAANVFVAVLVAAINPLLLCFGMFFCALVFFHLIKIKRLKTLYQKSKPFLKTVILLNITGFFSWYFVIFPLKYIEPAIVIAIVISVFPVATFLISLLLEEKRQVNLMNAVIVSLLLLGVVFLVAIVLDGKSAMRHEFHLSVILFALLACVVSGVALAFNNICAKQLSRNGFSPFEILTVRFILITLLSGILSWHQLPMIIHHKMWLHILIAAFAMIVIPQSVFQYALRELEPITISITSSLKPTVTFFLEIFDHQLVLTFWTILGVIYLAMVSMLGYGLQYKKLQYTRNELSDNKAKNI